MSKTISLKATDGHELDAYVAQPSGAPKAGLVVLQEIFGVSPHIRSVVDGFAKDGYLTIAPALFDRSKKHTELGYDPSGYQQGMKIVQRLKQEQTLADIAAAIQYLRKQGMAKVGVVGYCWGGTMAWLANARLHPDATISYYGGGVNQYIHEKPTAPAMFHFGERDKHIPKEAVEEVRAANPQFAVFTYDAGHAFNRDVDSSYDATSAKLARQRTLAHFDKYLVTGSNAD